MKTNSLTISALLALWVGSAHGEPVGSVATASECSPAAILSGESELVSELGQALALLGVVTRQPKQGCPHVTATVERGAAGVVVSLREPDGRSARRSLSDTRIAATWIDSWLHEDLGAPLLATRLVPLPAATSTNLTTPLTSTPIPPLSAAPNHIFHLSAGYDLLQRDSVAWQGLHASACIQWGAACLGIEGVLATSGEQLLLEGFSQYQQESVDLQASVEVPIKIAEVVVQPSLSLGASWLATQRIPLEDCSANGDAPPCPQAPVTAAYRSTWRPAAELGLEVALPVAGRVSLALGGALGLRLLGANAEVVTGSEETETEESDPFEEDPGQPVCTLPADPGCEQFPFEISEMPSDPSQSWRLFIGLEVEL